MKDKLIFLIMYLMFTNSVIAQKYFDDKNKKSKEKTESKFRYLDGCKLWLSAYAGAGFPKSDFATTGYAKTGFTYKGDIAIKLHKVFGIIVSAGGGYHDLDVDAVKKTYDFLNFFATLSGQKMTVDVAKNNWFYYGGLAGFYCRLFDENSPFYLKTQLGYYTAHHPEINTTITISGSGGSVTEQIISNPGTEGALAFCIGGGGKIHMSDNVSLLLNFDYLNFAPVYSNNTQIVSGNGTGINLSSIFGTGVNSFTLPIGIISISAGISYNIK